MKSLILMGLISTMALAQQTAPVSSGGSIYSPAGGAGLSVNPATGIASPITPSSSLNPAQGNFGQTTGQSNFDSNFTGPAGTNNINPANTAPTPIPNNTTLMGTPSNNPVQQSQEDFSGFPDNSASPGSGTTPGTGTISTPNMNNSLPTP